MDPSHVDLELPDTLVEKTDVAAEASQKNRSEVVEEALRDYVGNLADDDPFREAVVDLYLDDQIAFDVLVEFVGLQNAESVRASKTLLDQGGELADDL